MVGPTSAQLCGLWHLHPNTSGSFTGIAAFWGEYDTSKATFIVDGIVSFAWGVDVCRAARPPRAARALCDMRSLV